MKILPFPRFSVRSGAAPLWGCALAFLLSASAASAATAIHTNFVDHFSNIGNASTSLGGRTYLTGGATAEGSFSGDEAGWYGKGVCTGPYSIRFGNASNEGWARTPAIALADNAATGTVTVSFSAAGHPTSGNTSLSVVLLDSTDAEIAGTATTFTLARLASSTDRDIDAHTVDENGDPLSVTFADIPDSFKVRFQGCYSFLGSVLVTQEFDNGLTQLATPDVTVTPDVHELWLSWTANEHAYDYEVQILDPDGEAAGTWWFNHETSASAWTGTRVENLQESTEYTVRVRAVGDGTNYADSGWFEDTFSTKADPYRPEWTIGEPSSAPRVGDAFSFGVSAVCYEEQWGEFGPEQVPVAQTVQFDGLTPAVVGTQPAFASGVFSWTPDTDDDGDYTAAFSVENTGGTYTTNVAFTVKGLTEDMILFDETFAACEKNWNTSSASFSSAYSDHQYAWVQNGGSHRGVSGIRIGTQQTQRSITTPTISTVNDAAATVTLSFLAAGYTGTSSMTVSLSGATFEGGGSSRTISLVAQLAGAVDQPIPDEPDYSFTYSVSASGPFTITFAVESGDGRMGIDSVKVTQKVSTSIIDLAVPTGLAVVDGTLSTNSFSVAWDPVANATGYDVQFQVVGDTEWTAAPSVLTTNATFSGLADDVDYRVQVRATGDTSLYNYSDWTNLTVRTVRSALHPTLTVGASWANVIGDGKLYGVIPNTNAVSAALDDTTPVSVSLAAVAPAPSSAPVLADGALSWTPAEEDEKKDFTLFFEMTPAPGVFYTNTASFKVNDLPALTAPTVTVDLSSITNADGHASGRAGLSWDSQYRATEFSVRAWSGSPNLSATAARVEENFAGWNKKRPAGWIFRCTTGSAYTDAGAPVKLEATGHWFGTYDLGGVVTNVSFRAGGHSAGGSSTLRVYGVGALSDEDFGDKDNWGEPLAEIAVSEFGTTDRDFSIPVAAALGVRRIAWQYTKEGGNVGVGSVVIDGVGFSTPRFLPGWGPAPVSQGLATSCTVSPTRPGRTNWAEVTVTDGSNTFSKVVEIDVPDANPVTLLILK